MGLKEDVIKLQGDVTFNEDGVPNTIESAFVKPVCDQFHYLLKTKSGTFIEFNSMQYSHSGDIVSISSEDIRVFDPNLPKSRYGFEFNFERGLDIRASEIEWIVDAPSGS